MTGTLNVDPQKLIAASTEFGSSANKLRGLTSEMMNIVRSTNGVWTGEAQASYNNSFSALEDDMTKLFNIVTEHSKDLNEMAQTYINAENKAQSEAAALPKDVL